MKTIPHGEWGINCVLLNDTTVMNDDAIRRLEIEADEWYLQPLGQRFKVVQMTSSSAVLKSKGETFFADFEVNGNQLVLQLSRQNVKEKICINAEAITADVYV